MSNGKLLNIHPSELKFPFELRKQSSCTLQLTNKTNDYVAFKVKTTNPKKYCVRPTSGIISPGSSSSFTVTMQGANEIPPSTQCKDKFLLQSVIAPNGATNKDISSELFSKEDGKVIEEFRLRVVYILANHPSLVPEGSEEGSSPRSNHVEGRSPNATLLDDFTGSQEEPKEKPASAEFTSAITELCTAFDTSKKKNEELRKQVINLERQIEGWKHKEANWDEQKKEIKRERDEAREEARKAINEKRSLEQKLEKAAKASAKKAIDKAVASTTQYKFVRLKPTKYD